jgi:DNA-binding NarL/FixJ family response regulator
VIGEVCGEAADGPEAIEKANGLEAARELKRLFPSVALVMFTRFPTPHLKQEALSAGVSALVSKSEPAGLVADIQALLEPAS